MDGTVEWVKAVCAMIGVALLPVLSWWLTRAFERSRSDLVRTVQENLDRDRREAAQELEHLKTWLGEDLQRRLDAERAAVRKEMDKRKGELSRLAPGTNGVDQKRAEV